MMGNRFGGADGRGAMRALSARVSFGVAVSFSIIALLPTVASADGSLPVAITPSGDDGVSARASTKTLQDYNDAAIAKSIEDAKSSLPKDFKMPKGDGRIAPPVEVWTTLDVKPADGDAEGKTKTGVGADYKLNGSTKLGVSTERGTTGSGATGGSETDKTSAYMKFKAAPAVSVDARTDWSSKTEGVPGAVEQTDKGSLTIAPRVSKSFGLGDGKSVEPFVDYSHEFGLVSSGDALADKDRAGAGLTFKEADSYSLSVSTDVEGISTGDTTSATGKMQLKLPLP